MTFIKAIANNKEMFEIYEFNKRANRYGYKQFVNTNANGYAPKWEEVSRKAGLCGNCIKQIEKRVQG